jgi:hypothetical protein
MSMLMLLVYADNHDAAAAVLLQLLLQEPWGQSSKPAWG